MVVEESICLWFCAPFMAKLNVTNNSFDTPTIVFLALNSANSERNWDGNNNDVLLKFSK